MSAERRRGGWLKKLALGGAVLVVLVVAAAAAAIHFVPWEKVRQAAETKGSAALGRDVTIKALHVSLFSGVEIDGVTIGAPRQGGFARTPMVQASRIVAKYRLLPLLWLKVVINRVELVKPELFVERNRKGRWSFADLVAAAPAKAPPAKAAPVALPVDVNVQSLTITDAAVTVRDAGGPKPSTFGLDRLNVQVRGFALDGSTAQVKASVVAKLDRAELPIGAEGGLAINLNRSLLSLAGLTVSLPGLTTALAGDVKEFQVLPTLSVKTKTTVDLEKLMAALKPFLDPALAKATTLKGTVVVDADLGGTAKAPKIKGTVTCKGVGAGYQAYRDALENLEGAIQFTDDRVTMADVRGITVGIPFTVSCDIGNLGLARMKTFNYDKLAPKGKFTVVIPTMNVDRFMPAPGAGEPAAKGAKAPPPVEPDFAGMIPAGVRLTGDVRIDQIKARALTLGKATHKVTVTGSRIAFTREAEEYSGKETTSGWFDLGAKPRSARAARPLLTYDVTADLKGFQVGPFMADAMAAFLPPKAIPKGTLSGVAKLDAHLTGRGITMPNLNKNLAGKGRFEVADGKASGFVSGAGALVKALKADVLTKDLIYKSLTSDFTIAGGKVTTPNLTLDPGSAGDVGILYNGWLAFDPNDLSVKGELTDRINAAHAGDLLKNHVAYEDHGWAVNIWEVSDKLLPAPTILPSKKMVQKLGGSALQQKAKEVSPQLEQKGKELLKGLFKH